MPAFIILSYASILVLAVTISGYLSYHGLLQSAGEVTLPLVVFLMAIILTMDATISYFRSGEKRYRLPVFIWFVAAFFSVASNFNFLYSNFMREDVTQATVTRQVEVFRDDLVKTRAALAGLESVRYATTLRKDLTVELTNLRDQINDPLRPGCGEECRSHMAEIERILGDSITNLAVPPIGSDLSVVNDWYERYKSAAEAILSTVLHTTDTPAVEALARRIDDALLEYDSAARVLISKGGLDALPEMSDISLDIEREANALLPEDGKVSHSNIDPTLGRLGEIVYAFQNGFVERPNLMATFVSLILASVVDVLPFLLSFALFGKGRLEKNVRTGIARGSGERRIIE